MLRFFSSSGFVLIAVVLGLATGWFSPPPAIAVAQCVSDLFLNILKMLSLPIIFFAITSTVTGMESPRETARIGKRMVFYAVLTTILAALVGLGMYTLLDPSSAMTISTNNVAAVTENPSYLSFLLKIIPPNIVEAFAESNVLGIAFLAGFSGICTLLLPKEQKELLHKLFASVFSLILKMTTFVIQIMPIGIWAFVAIFVVEMRDHTALAHGLLLYVSAVIVANLVQGIIVLPALAKARGVSPWRLFRGMLPALAIAFFSKSSNAALPTSLKCAQENLGISKKVSNFTFPLGSVINMNGCAAFILITVLFVSTSEGWVFAWWEMLAWVGVATVAAIGNASVPMGCYFLASAILTGMHVPLTIMGIILPIYTLVDMIETAVNVWSNSCVTAMVESDLNGATAESSEAVPITQ